MFRAMCIRVLSNWCDSIYRSFRHEFLRHRQQSTFIILSFIVECERLIKEKCLNDRYHEYWWALRRSIGFYDPIIPWRVALQHFSLLLHRMQEFIISVSDGQPTYRHGLVHNLFKTVCCPTISVHPSATMMRWNFSPKSIYEQHHLRYP